MHAQPLDQCPLTTALDIIGGKWHLVVRYALAQQPRRFNELQRLAPGLSHKVLTQAVRHLETHGLVHRRAGIGAAPYVECSLSERGQTVRPIQTAVADWGHSHLNSEPAAEKPR